MGSPQRRPREDDDEQPRDRPFNGWRVPATTKARALVAQVTKLVEAFEAHVVPRKRRRKQGDQLTFEATISAIVCDLVHHHLSKADGGIAITRDNRKLARASRYRPSALNARLPHVLDCMASRQLDLVELTKGERRARRQTVIRVGLRLRRRIERNGITFGDIARDDAEEVILLKGSKPKRGEEAPPHVEPKASLVEYGDTRQTRRLREEIRAINTWLSTADLSLAEEYPGELAHIDLGERRLRRHLTRESFESGGRLFGAFWQTMRRDLRLSRLRINGEPVVSLDYRGMFVALAYARVGASLPLADPYAIPGIGPFRKGIKRLMTAALFRDSPMTRAPRGTRELLPHGVTVRELMQRIAKHHAPIARLLNTQIGHRLMFDESEIMVAVLRRLRRLNVVALPVHDAVTAARSDRDTTMKVMVEEYRARTGGMIEVEEQG